MKMIADFLKVGKRHFLENHNYNKQALYFLKC